MTGREEPSSEQLEQNLVKRFNRVGVHGSNERRHHKDDAMNAGDVNADSPPVASSVALSVAAS